MLTGESIAEVAASGAVEELVELRAQKEELLQSLRGLVHVVEQLIPEPSARGIAEVVLFGARAAIAKAEK